MSRHVQFGDDYAFSDIRAALVLDDGSIVRTINGHPMTAGTSLFLRTPLEQAAPMMLEALLAIHPFIPVSSAKDGGPCAHSGNVIAADKVRAAIAAATGENA